MSHDQVSVNFLLSCCFTTVSVFPPDQFVAVVNGSATFSCLSVGGGIVSVQWLLNGSLLNSGLQNVHTSFSPMFRVGILEFTNLPREYNNTRIGCRATATSGNTLLSRDATLLLLQGKFAMNLSGEEALYI